MSQIPPSSVGKSRGRLFAERLQAESEDTGQKTFPKSLGNLLKTRSSKPKTAKTSATPESPLTTSAETSNARQSISKENIPPPSSSKTSARGSTGTDLASRGFWSSSINERSQHLWLPTATDCAVLPSNSWSGSLKRLASNSWYSVRVKEAISHKTLSTSSPKTSLPSLTTLLPRTMDCEPPPTRNDETKTKSSRITNNERIKRETVQTSARNKEVQKTQDKKRKRRDRQREKRELLKAPKGNDPLPQPKKDDEGDNDKQEEDEDEKDLAEKMIRIRLFPNEGQKRTLSKWIGIARWSYNQSLSAVKEGTKRAKKDLRAAVVNNGVHLDKETAWVLQTPYDIRDEGMNDLLKAYASNFAKRAKNPNFTFEVRYRSKKKAQQESVVLHAKHIELDREADPREIGQLRFYKTFFGNDPLRSAESIPHLKQPSTTVASSETSWVITTSQSQSHWT